LLALFCVFGIRIGILEEKVMNEYKLTFTVTIKGQDDPAARQQAKDIAEAISEVVEDADVKLQQIYMDRAPRGVRMD
jgi:hypothetical protein